MSDQSCHLIAMIDEQMDCLEKRKLRRVPRVQEEMMHLGTVLKVYTGTIVCALGLATGAAHADFRVCNNTANRISIALAYTSGDTWTTEGWWNIKANNCDTLVRGALTAQYYYVYGMDERGGEWKGKTFMCTRDHEFKIEGIENCYARGYDRTGFFEVDTGKDAKTWTVQLTDPAKP